MSASRIPENARVSSRDREVLAGRIEWEVERIREARPHLSSRLDRASNLLLLQLASPPRQRPVKVRIAADGRRRFLVSSTSSNGVVYSVDPATYACSCPDAHRRGIGCKHGLCCFILRRVPPRFAGEAWLPSMCRWLGVYGRGRHRLRNWGGNHFP
jgi:hypothetical protein